MLRAAVLRRSCPHLLALVCQLVRLSALYGSFWKLPLWVPVWSGGGSFVVVAAPPPPRTGVVQPWLGLWGMLAEGVSSSW